MSIAVVVPTRSRPDNAERLINAWQRNQRAEGMLLFCVDDDDPFVEQYKRVCADQNGVLLSVAARNGFAQRLSQEALEICGLVTAVASWGDDHVPRTPGWDKVMLAQLDRMGGVGLIYGNDKVQGERIPTACTISSNIIEQLGYMVPPGLTHLYIDDYWLAIGRGIDRIHYMPHVIIEHLHPLAGTAPMDELYGERDLAWATDEPWYFEFRDNGGLQADIDKLSLLL